MGLDGSSFKQLWRAFPALAMMPSEPMVQMQGRDSPARWGTVIPGAVSITPPTTKPYLFHSWLQRTGMSCWRHLASQPC